MPTAFERQFDGRTLDLTGMVQLFHEPDDRIQVPTAPGPDGIVRRIEIRAQEGVGGSDWAVFALSNNGDEQIDRLLVSPHFRLAGSGWYETDFKKDGDKKRNLADGGGGDSKPAATTSSESAAPAPTTTTDKATS